MGFGLPAVLSDMTPMCMIMTKNSSVLGNRSPAGYLNTITAITEVHPSRGQCGIYLAKGNRQPALPRAEQQHRFRKVMSISPLPVCALLIGPGLGTALEGQGSASASQKPRAPFH